MLYRLMSSVFHNENCCHIGANHFSVLANEKGLRETLDRLFAQWREMNVEKQIPQLIEGLGKLLEGNRDTIDQGDHGLAEAIRGGK